MYLTVVVNHLQTKPRVTLGFNTDRQEISMYQIINFTEFCNAFRDMDRDNQFSLEGKRALFDYIERYEDETGESLELDVIELCSYYTEASYEEIAETYDLTYVDPEIENDFPSHPDYVRAHLEHYTAIAGEVPGGFVFVSF